MQNKKFTKKIIEAIFFKNLQRQSIKKEGAQFRFSLIKGIVRVEHFMQIVWCKLLIFRSVCMGLSCGGEGGALARFPNHHPTQPLDYQSVMRFAYIPRKNHDWRKVWRKLLICVIACISVTLVGSCKTTKNSVSERIKTDKIATSERIDTAKIELQNIVKNGYFERIITPIYADSARTKILYIKELTQWHSETHTANTIHAQVTHDTDTMHTQITTKTKHVEKKSPTRLIGQVLIAIVLLIFGLLIWWRLMQKYAK